jgi:hypothetical protein
MARETFHPGISRRRLLGSVAAATVSGVAPALRRVDAEVMPDAAQTASAAPDVSALNLSATMATRLLAIEQRQQIRREAGLPLLSVIKELKRMKTAETNEKCAQFEAAHGEAILDEMLRRRRVEVGDPNWTPRWAEAVAIGNRVRCTLLARFRAPRRCS